MKTLILYEGEGALQKTEKIENYYGFTNGIGGEELYQAGINQAKSIGVEIQKEEVTGMQMLEKGFEVKTAKDIYRTKTIILATGNKRNIPKIKNIEEFEGKGVSYCAICDGFFYRNKNISVVGSGNYAISELNELINLTDKITILTNGEKEPELRADTHEGINVNTKEIENIIGNEKVEEIRFRDGTTLKTEGIFVATGVAGTMEFAKKLGIITREKQNSSK